MKNKGKYRAILIDLSGTIHVDNVPIPGAVESIQKLYSGKFPVSSKELEVKDNRLDLSATPQKYLQKR